MAPTSIPTLLANQLQSDPHSWLLLGSCSSLLHILTHALPFTRSPYSFLHFVCWWLALTPVNSASRRSLPLPCKQGYLPCLTSTWPSLCFHNSTNCSVLMSYESPSHSSILALKARAMVHSFLLVTEQVLNRCLCNERTSLAEIPKVLLFSFGCMGERGKGSFWFEKLVMG